jgi:hypothetical protein
VQLERSEANVLAGRSRFVHDCPRRLERLPHPLDRVRANAVAGREGVVHNHANTRSP